MKYLRRAAHQEAYNEAAEDCLSWVKDVRLKRARAKKEAVLQHQFGKFCANFQGAMKRETFWKHWMEIRKELASKYEAEIVCAVEEWEKKARGIWTGEIPEEDLEDAEEDEQGSEDGQGGFGIDVRPGFVAGSRARSASHRSTWRKGCPGRVQTFQPWQSRRGGDP